RPLLAPGEIAFEPGEIRAAIERHARVRIQSFELSNDGHNLGSVQPPELRLNSRLEEPARLLVDFLGTYSGRALVGAESARRRESRRGRRRRWGFAPRPVDGRAAFLEDDAQRSVCGAPPPEGMHRPGCAGTAISEPQVFGERARTRA